MAHPTESRYVGPFLTHVEIRQSDGSLDVRTSWHNRRQIDPPVERPAEAAHTRRWWVWRPGVLTWWIAVLFMIGSWHFISGSVLVLVGYARVYVIDAVFFIGSLFFTAAGYSQYYQSINAPELQPGSSTAAGPAGRRFLAWQPHRIDFWATFPQFLGTLAFNVTTLAAFLDVAILGYDLLVWIPDFVGSILFLASGFAGVWEICGRFWCGPGKGLTWWIVMINFIGCVAFMVSAFAAFVRPHPIFNNLATWATITTLIGAVCFFVGAYLMWPEMADSPQD